MVISTPKGNIDTLESFNYSFNYNIEDVENASARKGNFSKTIIVPNTPTNNKIFEYSFDVNVEGLAFDSTKSIECKVINNGTVVFNGRIYLVSIVTNNGITYCYFLLN